MTNFLHSVIKYRKITLFFVVVLMVAGTYAYYIMPRSEMPDVATPIAILTVVYPGAEPQAIDKHVVQKIEDKIVELEGYDFSSSHIFDSFALIQLRMAHGIDTEKTWSELRRSMDELLPELPEQVTNINITTNLIETSGIILAITGENYSYEELTDYAENLARLLSKVDGMTRFTISGKQDQEVIIKIDYKLLNQIDVSLDNIVMMLRGQNLEIPSGRITNEDIPISVKAEGFFTDLDDIRNLPLTISPETGTVLRLGDIAEVDFAIRDDMYRVSHDSKQAILLSGFFKPHLNVVNVGKEINRIVEDFRVKLPQGIEITSVISQPRDVKASTNELAMSLLQGVVFVIIVVFVGMGIRNAIIVSTVIPLSLVVTLIFMNLLNIELHLISIASLIIALGMLVDNAIVVSDAIQWNVDAGMDQADACVEGVKEVAIPVLTSTLTTVAAFLPFLMMDSIAGEFMQSLPWIIIISLTVSYLTAILVTPVMAYIFFRPGGEKRDKTVKIRAFFTNTLRKTIANPLKAYLVIGVLLAITVFLATQLDLQFFPYADKNMMFIDIKAESNIDINTTKKVTDQIERILAEEQEVKHYTTSIGGALPKFYTTVFNFGQSADTAQILIEINQNVLKNFTDYNEYVAKLQKKIDESLLGGRAVVKRLELAEYIGSPIQLRVSGENLDDLEAGAMKIKDKLREIEGLININDDFPARVYRYNIAPDVTKAAYIGLSKYEIQNEINIALSGRKASTLHYLDEEFDIVIKTDIASLEDLSNLYIKSSMADTKTILKNIADLEIAPILPGINKYDRDYAIMITADLMPGIRTGDMTKIINKKLQELDLTNCRLAYDGEQEKIMQNFGAMGFQAVFAVVLVYIILLFQFKSFLQPLVIMFTIPLSAIGSISGLFLLRQPLSFTGLMGMISLMGIVVNNAIVLLDYINKEREDGHDVGEACINAAAMRFRPIMLASVTTFIGMIPLVMSGSSLFMPLSIVLMFGLMVSTLLTLLVVPLLYYTFVQGSEQIRMPRKKDRNGRINLLNT